MWLINHIANNSHHKADRFCLWFFPIHAKDSRQHNNILFHYLRYLDKNPQCKFCIHINSDQHKSNKDLGILHTKYLYYRYNIHHYKVCIFQDLTAFMEQNKTNIGLHMDHCKLRMLNGKVCIHALSNLYILSFNMSLNSKHCLFTYINLNYILCINLSHIKYKFRNRHGKDCIGHSLQDNQEQYNDNRVLKYR